MIDTISFEEDSDLGWELDWESNSDLEASSNSKSKFDSTVEIAELDGTVKNIHKSTLLWMLSDTNDKLSTDRLKRVRGSTTTDTGLRKKFKSDNVFKDASNVLKLKELNIGDWALFDLKNV